MLAIGALAALACAFGSVWVIRAGVLVALLVAAGALTFAFRQMSSMRKAHLAELKTLRASAATANRTHHAESMRLIADFTHRVREHGEQVEQLRTDLATTRQELSSVRGNLVSARADGVAKSEQITALQGTVGELEEQVAALVAQLSQALSAAQSDQADVVTLPTRAISRKALAAQLPTAAELWQDGEFPTSFSLEAFDLELLTGEGASAPELRKHA